jgi:hypothetical protein
LYINHLRALVILAPNQEVAGSSAAGRATTSPNSPTTCRSEATSRCDESEGRRTGACNAIARISRDGGVELEVGCSSCSRLIRRSHGPVQPAKGGVQVSARLLDAGVFADSGTDRPRHEATEFGTSIEEGKRGCVRGCGSRDDYERSPSVDRKPESYRFRASLNMRR